MVTRTLVPTLMLILLLGAQAGIPSLANASDCCPCYVHCANWCKCRGTNAHCSSCRAGESDLFQQHVVAITPSSDYSATQQSLSILPALLLTDLSGELVALVKKGNRTIGDFTSRLMAGAEFRINSWCPGSLDKSV
jgi:hypothetical protein